MVASFSPAQLALRVTVRGGLTAGRPEVLRFRRGGVVSVAAA
ncbi:MAG: hypothetical protein ACRDQX_08340 [Pseudonocardiaceae bacterium]